MKSAVASLLTEQYALVSRAGGAVLAALAVCGAALGAVFGGHRRANALGSGLPSGAVRRQIDRCPKNNFGSIVTTFPRLPCKICFDAAHRPQRAG